VRIILVAFWTVMIFASILWYALLLFYVGAKGGYEIFQMARTFSARPEEEE
jgi:hypothetical protein